MYTAAQLYTSLLTTTTRYFFYFAFTDVGVKLEKKTLQQFDWQPVEKTNHAQRLRNVEKKL